MTDPNGSITLRLKYRIDPSSTYASSNMVDNGTGGDAISGDGIFSALIPGQNANVVVPFYVEAVDGLGATNTFPTDVFPTAPLPRVFPLDAVTRELVVRWGDTQRMGSLATYHVWLTSGNDARSRSSRVSPVPIVATTSTGKRCAPPASDSKR